MKFQKNGFYFRQYNSPSNLVMCSAFITPVLIEKETCSFLKNQVLSPPFFYSIHRKTSLKLNYLGHNQTKESMYLSKYDLYLFVLLSARSKFQTAV